MQADFFEDKIFAVFDVILPSPPYIQYGRLSDKIRNPLDP